MPLSAEEQAYFQPTINEMASEAESLGLGRTANTPWPGSSCGWAATMPRLTTAPSATPWWTSPPLTSSA